MNVMASNLRASSNCSSTRSFSLSILYNCQAARAAAKELEVAEDRGFHHSVRLNELY